VGPCARSANRFPASRATARRNSPFFWAPLHFGDGDCTFMTSTTLSVIPSVVPAALLPRDGSALTTHGALTIEMQRGTRWLHRAVLTMGERAITLSPLLRFQMRGAGYSHPSSRTGAGTGDRS